MATGHPPEEGTVPPTWLTGLSWVSLVAAFASAVLISYDLFVRGYRQRMGVMDAVWPVTALYFGPLAMGPYWQWGRPGSARWLREHQRDTPPRKPAFATTCVGVAHCGAGCTLGDIIAEFAIWGLGLMITGQMLFAEYVGDYVLAVALGLAFQYFAIAPMRGLDVRKGIVAAAKADIASLSAFEVGLFAWMALMSQLFFPAPHQLHPNSPVYWFLMQIGMIVGFATSYPVNVWLIRRGIKEAM
jgi:hypothetical protein